MAVTHSSMVGNAMQRKHAVAASVVAMLIGFVLGRALSPASNGPGNWKNVAPLASTAPFMRQDVPADCGFAVAPRIQLASADSNPLWRYIEKIETGPRVNKWGSYFDIYDRYFSRFRGRTTTMLEIGVQSGGSIGMWFDYFGDGLTYRGVDINEYCEPLFADPPRVTITIGDQSNRTFWQEMRNSGLHFDVILDDGGHSMKQQIVTFEETWGMLNEGGIYMTEDIATSFDRFTINGKQLDTTEWGGGFGKRSTFSQYAKNLTDSVNGHYINIDKHPNWKGAAYTYEMLSIAFYDQMVVIEKGDHPASPQVDRGNFKVEFYYDRKGVDPEKLEKYKEEMAASLQ